MKGRAEVQRPLPNLDVTPDDSDSGIVEEGDQDLLNGVSVKRAVRIDMDDETAPGVTPTEVGGRGLSPPNVVSQVPIDFLISEEVPADDLCLVVGTVVDDNDFKVFVGLFVEGLDQVVKMSSLVLPGDHDGNERVLL